MKQRSFDDSVGISFVLIDADLLLKWMNNLQLRFRFHLASCPILPAVLIISRGECKISALMISDRSFDSDKGVVINNFRGGPGRLFKTFCENFKPPPCPNVKFSIPLPIKFKKKSCSLRFPFFF